MKKALLVLIVCQFPGIAQAQIAYDASSITGLTSGVTTCTLSHTVGAGSDRILFASVLVTTSDLIDTATYDSVPMTLVGKVQNEASLWNYLWYLVAPNTGTHNVVFSNNAAATLTATMCAASSYTGVDQTSPIDTSTTNTGSGSPITSLTTTLTTTTANSWAILWSRNNAGAQSAGTGSTQRVEDDSLSVALYDSNGALSAGSNSMTANFSSSPTLASAVMAAFCPSTTGCTGGGGITPCSKPGQSLLLGVGCHE